jgi:dTDP-4-dehydrorhamnose reductase
MKYLILGNKGQLGREFDNYFSENSFEYKGCAKPEIDASNFDSVKSAIDDYSPDIILNCIAYNQVDMAEKNPELANLINRDFPSKLSLFSKSKSIYLVHFSSDYVYSPNKNKKLKEDSNLSPINLYGLSKLQGDEQVYQNNPKSLILRLSWLYSKIGKQNFIYKILQAANKHNELSVVTDEVSVPTSTNFVVKTTLEAINHNLTGIYNLCPNGNPVSRYDLADYVLNKIGGRGVLLNKINQSDFGLMAKRPVFSAMDSQKIQNELSIIFPTWQEDLKNIYMPD